MTAAESPQRLTCLDQFRGYTVVGMFLVNFVGSFTTTPEILKHRHDYCSYADTIMPHFLFAVGFAFRLTFERRVKKDGTRAAYARMVRRLLGLVLLSIVIYPASRPAETWAEFTTLPFTQVLGKALKREWFQTLMHIAATSLWILPWIRTSARTRIAFAAASGALHVFLSWWFNFTWCNTGPNAIDGGPLGFLTWTIPAIAGSAVCDLVTSSDRGQRWLTITAGGLGLMLFGWVLSCGTRFYDVPAELQPTQQDLRLSPNPVLPATSQLVFRGTAELPFVAPPDSTRRKWNYWMMSQRAATLSYLTFGAGLSVLVYAAFHVLSGVWKVQIGLFRVFGTNALAGYVLHLLVMQAVKPFIPKDAPGWYVMLGLLVFFGIMWIFVRHLEKNNVYFRL